ncbi:MAG: 4-(cytidine 5'-diphospho)-2-C-methyl-D-erythritol kinase [Actinomycetaceae bacterium]|nr:4-(cytidine 5'-diphospho)-2-C-methyl-D-erythritol kinase [Actinomycetaceae bacterium]
MQEVHVCASAKVNPALFVGPVGDDGFHELDIFFESIDIFDDIYAYATDSNDIKLEVEGDLAGTVPTDSSNLAVKAAQALRDAYGVEKGVRLRIVKRIPVAGGLAGGSADAAGTLLACNELWQLGLSQEELMKLGATLGSDIPFCLLGSLARASGRGTVLTGMKPGTMHFWVLVSFDEGLSTPAIYRHLDELRDKRGEMADLEHVKVKADKVHRTLEGDNIDAIGECLHNDLAEAAISMRPELQKIIDKAQEFSVKAVVSGSGPTIAVLAREYSEANALAGALSNEFPHARIIRANGPAAGAHIRSSR